MPEEMTEPEALDTPDVILRRVEELEQQSSFDHKAFTLAGRLLKAGRDLDKRDGWPSREASLNCGKRVIMILTNIAKQMQGIGASDLFFQGRPPVPSGMDTCDALLTLLAELEQVQHFDVDCRKRLMLMVAAARSLERRGGWPSREIFDDFGRRVLLLMTRMGYGK